MSKRPFAVFDIDGTIFRFSLLIELVKVLVRNGVFAPEIEGQFKAQYEQWQNRIGSYDDYIDNVVRAFRAHIKGVELTAVMDAARQVVDEQGQRTYTYTRDLIKAYRSQGLFLAYVSHSPHAVVGEFARHFNFDAHQGTLYIPNRSPYACVIQRNFQFLPFTCPVPVPQGSQDTGNNVSTGDSIHYSTALGRWGTARLAD